MTGWVRLTKMDILFKTNDVICTEKPFSTLEAWYWMVSYCEFVGDKKGSFTSTEKYICEQFGWSRQALRTWFKRLKEANRIQPQTTHNSTTITIINFASYQGFLEVCKEQTNHNLNNEEKDTIFLDKKKKKELILRETNPRALVVHEVLALPLPKAWGPKAREALSSWATYRAQIKKPLLAQSWLKLIETYADRPQDFYAAVNQSIQNGYQGLFEVKASVNSFRPNSCATTVEKNLQYLAETEDGPINLEEMFDTFFNRQKDIVVESDSRGGLVPVFTGFKRGEGH